MDYLDTLEEFDSQTALAEPEPYVVIETLTGAPTGIATLAVDLEDAVQIALQIAIRISNLPQDELRSALNLLLFVAEGDHGVYILPIKTN